MARGIRIWLGDITQTATTSTIRRNVKRAFSIKRYSLFDPLSIEGPQYLGTIGLWAVVTQTKGQDPTLQIFLNEGTGLGAAQLEITDPQSKRFLNEIMAHVSWFKKPRSLKDMFYFDIYGCDLRNCRMVGINVDSLELCYGVTIFSSQVGNIHNSFVSEIRDTSVGSIRKSRVSIISNSNMKEMSDIVVDVVHSHCVVITSAGVVIRKKYEDCVHTRFGRFQTV